MNKIAYRVTVREEDGSLKNKLLVGNSFKEICFYLNHVVKKEVVKMVLVH